MRNKLKRERMEAFNYNKQGILMKVIQYNNASNIIVEFQDKYKETKRTDWRSFKEGRVINPIGYKKRIGTENVNNQGDLMKVVEYIDSNNVIVEFQDKYHERAIVTWGQFSKRFC